MKLTAQEAQLAYEALRVVNAALTKHKIDLIRDYNTALKADAKQPAGYKPTTTTEPAFDELNKTFDVQDAMYDLLQKFEKHLNFAGKKKKKPKDGKNERRT